MVTLAICVTNLLLLTFTQAAHLHSHSDLQCNHVHPKPNDVSKVLSIVTMLWTPPQQKTHLFNSPQKAGINSHDFYILIIFSCIVVKWMFVLSDSDQKSQLLYFNVNNPFY